MDNAQICIDELKKKAEKGDPEAIKAIIYLELQEQLQQLRKELFGV